MIISKREKEIIKKAIDEYEFMKEEIENQIEKGHDIEEFLMRFKDLEYSIISNDKSYFLDIMYKDICFSVGVRQDKKTEVSDCFQIWDIEKSENIVDEFWTKEDYKQLINKTTDEELHEMSEMLKYYEDKHLYGDYKSYVQKIIDYVKEK